MTKQTDAEIVARYYIIAALWADSPEGTNPRATKSAQDTARKIAGQFLKKIGPDNVKALEAAHRENGYGSHPDCGYDRPWLAACGNDLWLTSQGHGTGFWDRDELPEALQNTLDGAARKFDRIYPEFYRGWFYLRGSMPTSMKFD